MEEEEDHYYRHRHIVPPPLFGDDPLPRDMYWCECCGERACIACYNKAGDVPGGSASVPASDPIPSQQASYMSH